MNYYFLVRTLLHCKYRIGNAFIISKKRKKTHHTQEFESERISGFVRSVGDSRNVWLTKDVASESTYIEELKSTFEIQNTVFFKQDQMKRGNRTE